MCTSWPVTPSLCPTSASQWPRRAPQAWQWLPHPAPPTAAPQTEPTPLNWLVNWIHLKGWGGAGATLYCVTPLLTASHLAMKCPRGETGQMAARGGWEVMDGLGRQHVTLHPSHIHLPQPTCPAFSKGWHDIVLGVKALDDSHSKGRVFAACWWKMGFNVPELSFLL